MKAFVLGVAVAAAFGANQAVAACSNGGGVNQVNNPTVLTTLLSGKTVCGRPGTGYTGSSTDRWQEEHIAGGALFDFKLGGNAMDPRAQVGTWVVSGTGANTIVTHAYTGGSSYAWKVFDNGNSTYSFCSAANVEFVLARIQAGTNAACTSFP